MIRPVKTAFIGMSVLLLAGCSSFMLPTDYETFHEKATELNHDEDPEVKKVKIVGKGGDESYTVTLDADAQEEQVKDLDEDTQAFVVAAMFLAIMNTPEKVENVEGAKYYLGNGFKYVEDEITSVWNKYGMLTEYSGKDDDGNKMSIKYTYTYK